MPRAKRKLKIKLPPPPTKKATLTPKFLRVFKVPRSRTPTGPETKVPLPPFSAKVPRIPKLIRAPRTSPFSSPIDLPRPRSKFDKYPRIIRIARSIKSLLKVEPDKPVRMPRFPTLGFPRLYTRFPLVKTYTAITDSLGRVAVTFPRVFRSIPGVVLTGQGNITWFPIVLSRDQFGFTARILKTAHKHTGSSGSGGGHGHTTSSAGAHGHTAGLAGAHGHTATAAGAHGHTAGYAGGHGHGGSTGIGGAHGHVVADGGSHWHSVSGYLNLILNRSLAIVTAQVLGESGHTHSNPDTSGPSTSSEVMTGLSAGSGCDSGFCVTGFDTGDVAGLSHTHSQGSTGGSTGHHHDLSLGSSNFVYDVDINIGAWTSDTHWGHNHPLSDDSGHEHSSLIISDAPDHFHTISSASGHTHPLSNAPNHLHTISSASGHTHPISSAPSHVHGISEDAAAALANTEVTFTYLASEES